MTKFIEELETILDAITAQDVQDRDDEMDVYDFDTAAIDLIEKRLNQAGYNVSVMESRYYCLPSGRNSNENYVSPTHFTVANSNGEKAIIELELEIYSSDCERYVDDVSFKLYTEKEWQELADKYLKHLTKDELTMILSIAVGSIRNI